MSERIPPPEGDFEQEPEDRMDLDTPVDDLDDEYQPLNLDQIVEGERVE